MKQRDFEIVKPEHRVHKKEVNLEHLGSQTIYAPIKLPTRATRKSAGYDIYLPVPIMVLPHQTLKVYLDIKAYMMEDEALKLYPRSSVAEQGIVLSAGTNIIDSDYYENQKNDGNIALNLYNRTGRGVEFKAGERIAQGVFVKYLTTDSDLPMYEKRVGETGSSGR